MPRGHPNIRKGEPRGYFSTNRGLADFSERFGPQAIPGAIERRWRSHERVRVLEIGCGEGRTLLELRKLFPDIELHGLNKTPWRAMQGTASLRETAAFHGILTPDELARVPLPVIHFGDACKLDFDDASFDVVISQVALHYVERKDAMLEEVWRVLAPAGEAWLHMDTFEPNLPDFLHHPTPRFVIYRDGQRVPLREFLAPFTGAGYDVQYVEPTRGRGTSAHLLMRRNTSAALRLGLTFDEVASFDMNVLNNERPRWDVYWGYRSVFHVVGAGHRNDAGRRP